MRLRFHVEGGDAVADGGYLVALRSYHQGSHRGSGRSTADSNLGRWVLPAIAAVPGSKGLDRYEQTREGLAECVVMCRPIQMTSEGAPECDGITFLHNEALLQIFRVGDAVQVHLVARVQEFFLGLNAGTWLKIRMQQISDAAQDHVQQHHATQLAAMRSSTAEQVLRSGGLDMNRHVELPPADAAYLFDHWGAGGNSGVSGQRCLPSGVDPRTSPGGVGGEAAQVGQYVPWAYQPLGGGTAERGGCKAGNQRRESSAHLSSQAES